MAAATPLTPSVSWAQRPSIIFLTINVSDVTEPQIKVERGDGRKRGRGTRRKGEIKPLSLSRGKEKGKIKMK